MIGAILFVAGSLFSAAAPNVEVLILSRVLLGLAVGVASYTAPLYLSEIAPEKIRGSMISMYQLMITIGILGAYLSDTAFSYTGAWRWMLGVIIIPAILLLIGVFFLPDSPRWFAAKRRFVDAERVLLRLRDTSAEAKRELDEIRESLQVKQSGWALFKENSNFRRAVFLGVLLQVMQQFTGMNVIMYYAPKIFELAGYTNTTEQMWGTVIVGLTNVLATFIAIGLVDRWGRKPTLTLGFLVMAAGMGVLGTMMHIGIHSPSAQYFAIAMLLMFIVGFAMSAGPLIWVLCSEIQPLKGRDFGITCSTATNWIANMIVGATFLTMLNTLGNANTFWVYAALNVLFILLTLWLVPETNANAGLPGDGCWHGRTRYNDAYRYSLSVSAVFRHRHAADVYCRFCHECRSADLGTVLRNSAAERPRFWHHLLHRHQLDCQHDRWRNVPDHAQHAG